MASFVREVLSATGRLGEKENFSGKAARLQNRVDDLKSNLRERIVSRYEDFSGSFAEVSTAVLQLEDVIKEVESLDQAITTHLKPSLNDANRETVEISRQLRDLSYSVQMANLTKCSYEALEDASELLYAKKYNEASQKLAIVNKIIAEVDTVKNNNDEDTKRSIEAIKKEYGTLQDKTSYVLGKDWDESLLILPTFSQDNKEVLESTKLNFSYMPGDGSLKALVQAMQSSDILSFRMQRLCQDMLNYVFKPLISKSCHLQETENGILLKVLQHDHHGPNRPLEVLLNLERVLYLIAKCFEFETENQENFNSIIGIEIVEKLTDYLLKNCLYPSIPNKKSLLEDFNCVINGVKSFESTLVDLKLTENTKALAHFRQNLHNTFVTQRCQSILVQARKLMKRELHQTVRLEQKMTMSYEESETTFKTEFNIDVDIDEEEALLALPKGISLNDGLFKFPSCQVSTSMLDLMKLVEEVLEEATAGKNDTLYAGRLLVTVRNIFDMYNDILPISHSEALKNFPLNSAIGYNNCMYLAHQCLQIVIPSDNLPEPLTARPLTLADLVPRLRQTGIDVFLSQLRRQRDHFRSMLRDSTTGFGQLDGSNLLPPSSEKCLRQVLHQMMHLKSLWKDALPLSIFRRSLGVALNTVVDELVQKVVVLEDIAADAAVQICMHFTLLQDKGPDLFVVEGSKQTSKGDIVRYVLKWNRFKELILILNASLREIEDRWADGKGPLANEYTPDEVKRLIRALFQNTDRRATILSQIK